MKILCLTIINNKAVHMTIISQQKQTQWNLPHKLRFLTFLWPYIKVKVIHRGMKLYVLVLIFAIFSLKAIGSSTPKQKPMLKVSFSKHNYSCNRTFFLWTRHLTMMHEWWTSEWIAPTANQINLYFQRTVQENGPVCLAFCSSCELLAMVLSR